ncbi:DUF2927 domain-containing protein [Methylophaga sp. OBS4]|uniref:DUF2927 domain-containing protein n=1 Tax=Methylophaga sp. OBS4 TaxID=2991935 RepID=UPI00225B34D4|nr:DUF2927 domain-containing protein [Methylophaga sp. OBS4]MCX4187937.1 DUF2927 domain-containing protein [Methylophaga sp. OBS4]
MNLSTRAIAKPLSLLFCSALLACLAGDLSADSPHWHQPDYIINSFLSVAMQNEHGPSDGRLHKWQVPISYQIEDRTGDQQLHKRLVYQQFQHLSAITGLEIVPASSATGFNVRIIFSSEEQLYNELSRDLGLSNEALRKQISHGSVCIARFKTNQHSAIESAVVIIPVDRARAHGKLLACIVEELTQILGMPNDSTEVYPSIFNDYSFNDFLTGLDYILLKLLYSPELTTGMDTDQVRQKLQTMIQKAGVAAQLLQADRLVRQQGLETLLD